MRVVVAREGVVDVVPVESAAADHAELFVAYRIARSPTIFCFEKATFGIPPFSSNTHGVVFSGRPVSALLPYSRQAPAGPNGPAEAARHRCYCETVTVVTPGACAAGAAAGATGA